MTTVQAFFLGIMVSWTPSLLLLAWLLRDLPTANSEDQLSGAHHH
jgi:hypothetical protein